MGEQLRHGPAYGDIFIHDCDSINASVGQPVVQTTILRWVNFLKWLARREVEQTFHTSSLLQVV